MDGDDGGEEEDQEQLENNELGVSQEAGVEDPRAATEFAGGRQPPRRLWCWVVEQLGPSCSIARNAAVCHGIVHRLDTDTSGALLVAKTYRGYFQARLQFAGRSVLKAYVCVCCGWLPTEPRLLDSKLLRQRSERDDCWITVVAREGAATGTASAPSVPQLWLSASTEVRHVEHLLGPGGERLSLVHIVLHTGRTHQIRAHLSAEGHPLAGDTLYGRATDWLSWCPRLCLHARRLAIGGGIAGERIDVEVPLPDDLKAVLRLLTPQSERGRTELDRLLLDPSGY
ncbi:unnamed protein product [Polarella glacialis]|uniref:Pseudouridine synthase RsuA/RluA-like domain-containing protein n=2 Tax=Polarella glacialis TaxID=89957 RepID=A0A813FUS7_POLGL|nr:unnamed protein product [Polarella glacialis]